MPNDTSIKERVEKIIMFTSDNESIKGKESLRIFHSALGGEIVNIPGYGHYLMSDMGTEEFQELIDVILN